VEIINEKKGTRKYGEIGRARQGYGEFSKL
jgi:hypothetical protein